MANSKILTSEDKMKLRQPIDEYVGKIQKQIDVLRKDGTAKVLEYQNVIDGIKRDRTLTKGERENRISQYQVELDKAKAVENKNKDEMQVMRRTCGYIGSNMWGKGRTQEIGQRVLHL